jgi:hypothetical protein
MAAKKAPRKTAAKQAGKPATTNVQKATPNQDAEERDSIPQVSQEDALAAAQRTAATTAAAVTSVPDSPVVQNRTLADAPIEVLNAASVMAGRMATSGNTDPVNQQVQAYVSDIDQAVALRAAQAKALAATEQAQLAQAEVERLQSVSPPAGTPTPGEQGLRAPMDNAMQKRNDIAHPTGISPDVTSPTTGPVGQVARNIPGTGVADIRDLAPGQDLSPSPPVSSSNILPQPNKPGSVFSKL